ncbi:PIR Superfamily Protein [Plasmodium malariae]|uniref:PIR Superfamily Protein n=1 Tax=Plasmodium malariae TaxID=5858 RepID=A0A1A8WRN3_PLAMA|nr:PIR Superfamily Protein [Plasmodium malariae]
MVKLETSKIEKLRLFFEEDTKPSDFTEKFSSFSSLEGIHENLYKIGYMLHNNFKSKLLNEMLINDIGSESGNVTISVDDYCELLNEWLNNKKYIYINEGSNCEENRQLWEKHIEGMWELLKTYLDNSFLCNRDTTPYICSASSDLKTALSVGFTFLGTCLISCFFLYKFSPLGPWINNNIKKKKRITKNIFSEESSGSFERSSKNGEITIGYHFLLNEWLNNKKYIYINEGSNCEENRQLWEKHIEGMWELLKTYLDNSFLCNRDTTPYICSASSDLKTALSVGFTFLGTCLISCFFLYKFSPLGPWINNNINKKKRITKNIFSEESSGSFERSSKNGEITIGYHFVEDS